MDTKVAENLVNALKDGNQSAFRQLYDNYKQPLFQTALAICRNQSDAEDVLQDSFVKIFRKINTLRNAAVLESWMYRIVINSAKSMTNGPHRKWNDLEEAPLKSNPVQDSQWDQLTKALQDLPLGYRNVFVLHALQEIPQENVAEILGVSLGTVKSQFHRARKKLQKILKKSGVHYE